MSKNKTIGCDKCGERIALAGYIPKKCPECGEEIYHRMNIHVRRMIFSRMQGRGPLYLLYAVGILNLIAAFSFFIYYVLSIFV